MGDRSRPVPREGHGSEPLWYGVNGACIGAQRQMGVHGTEIDCEPALESALQKLRELAPYRPFLPGRTSLGPPRHPLYNMRRLSIAPALTVSAPQPPEARR